MKMVRRLKKHQTGPTHFTPKQMRRELYLLKVNGIIWFIGDIPESDDEPIFYHTNYNFDGFSYPENAAELAKMDCEALRKIASRIEEPAWTKKFYRLKWGSINQFLEVQKEINLESFGAP
jgi:hypothetical protein